MTLLMIKTVAIITFHQLIPRSKSYRTKITIIFEGSTKSWSRTLDKGWFWLSRFPKITVFFYVAKRLMKKIIIMKQLLEVLLLRIVLCQNRNGPMLEIYKHLIVWNHNLKILINQNCYHFIPMPFQLLPRWI